MLSQKPEFKINSVIVVDGVKFELKVLFDYIPEKLHPRDKIYNNNIDKILIRRILSGDVNITRKIKNKTLYEIKKRCYYHLENIGFKRRS